MSHLRAVPDGPTGPRESTVPPRSGSASSVRVEAPGKVNLFLSVGAPGTDGYHPLTTVFPGGPSHRDRHRPPTVRPGPRHRHAHPRGARRRRPRR